jgi:hypothetical protein
LNNITHYSFNIINNYLLLNNQIIAKMTLNLYNMIKTTKSLLFFAMNDTTSTLNKDVIALLKKNNLDKSVLIIKKYIKCNKNEDNNTILYKYLINDSYYQEYIKIHVKNAIERNKFEIMTKFKLLLQNKYITISDQEIYDVIFNWYYTQCTLYGVFDGEIQNLLCDIIEYENSTVPIEIIEIIEMYAENIIH